MGEYYLNTFSVAFQKISTTVIFLVVGYFIFFKLPFLFFLRNMKKQKEEVEVKPLKNEQPQKILIHKEQKTKSQERKQESKYQKELPAKEKVSFLEAHAVFGISEGTKLTQVELKKRYLELLKQNHPDKVASLGDDFKKLAEKKTKEINHAYEKLKSKAS